jgi:hypothetical protein
MNGRTILWGRWTAAALLLAFAANPLFAAQTILRDQFQLDAAGEDLSTLLAWNPAFSNAPATEGTIISAGAANRVLRIDPVLTSGADSNLGIASKFAYNHFSPGNKLSVAVDILFSNDGITDSQFAATFGLGSSLTSEIKPRYFLAIAEGSQTVSLLSQGLFTSDVLASGTFNPGFARHTYELQSFIQDDSILFKVLIDSFELFTFQDNDPLTIGSSIKFGLGANFGNNVLFDNFHAQLIPEPSAFLLATLGALGLLVARRRQQSR